MKKIFTPVLYGFLFFVLLSAPSTAKAQTRAVYFSGYNSATESFPKAASGYNNAIVSSGAITYSGLMPVNDGRTVWNNPNTAATLDVATTPYLSYTVTMNGTVMLQPDRFVLCGLATFNNSMILELRWSVDNYASNLGQFTINGSSYTLSSVDLSSYGPVSVSSIQFRVYFYNGSGWVFNSHTGPYPSLDGTASSYGASGQNVALWYNSFSTLPLSWKSFTVQQQQDKALLLWSTENEVNTADFEIQHSHNGRDWQVTGNIAARNTTGTHQYSFLHQQPIKGTNFYRLMQTDLDGRKTYSETVMLRLEESTSNLQVLGNPVKNGLLQLRLAQNSTVQLFNSTGVLVWQQSLFAGNQLISVSHLSKGIYTLKTATDRHQVVIQ